MSLKHCISLVLFESAVTGASTVISTLTLKVFQKSKRRLTRQAKKYYLLCHHSWKKSEFSKEKTALTYSVAKVRIDVERIMQRLMTYKILQFIPEHFFSSIDDVLHMACVLVNLQPPIISGIEIK